MRSILGEYLNSLSGKRIAVMGIGVSNTPLIRKLLEAELSVIACDKRERIHFDGLVEELEENGLETCLGTSYLDGVLNADVIFRTPGMRPDLPQIREAVERGAVLTSEMEAFLDICPCRMIAVTGSDGKTTTTSMIAGMLSAAGLRTFTGGNIGRPLLCDVDSICPDDVVVLELSSFQLLTMSKSPDVAVITNISPNHLDVHKGMEEYVQAKRNIFLHQGPLGRLILNADDDTTLSFAQEARGETVLFSRRHVVPDGVYLKDGVIYRRVIPVISGQDILLPGVHNLENYMAAIAAVEGLVPDAIIRSFANSFGGVAHRIELIRELNGVRYYNDSIASSPSRTIAGLRSFDQKVILIAGGYDKQIPYDVLGPEIVRSVRDLILVGATSPKIRAAVLASPEYRAGVPGIHACEDLKQAVAVARSLAAPGDIVLLSPASASFDQFKNFEERGNTFRRFVEEL